MLLLPLLLPAAGGYHPPLCFSHHHQCFMIMRSLPGKEEERE
jgi:hypothetical protein